MILSDYLNELATNGIVDMVAIFLGRSHTTPVPF